MPDFESIKQYPTLREEQRLEARYAARENLMARMGGEPHLEDYEKQRWSRFGVGFELATLCFVILVFLSALWVSSEHIYRVFDNSPAMVVLAESTVLALSLVPTVWNTPRPVTLSMYVGIAGAALIAAVGNIDAEIVYSPEPFNWIGRWWGTLLTSPKQWAAATMPPLMTVLVGQGLKYYALSRSGNRHEAKVQYDIALMDWKQKIADLENHPDWRNVYAFALWDTWKHGKRREVLIGITSEERELIVLRELAANNFFQKISEISEKPVKVPHENNTHAVRRVLDFLKENPAHFQFSGAEISEKLGVSEPSVSRGKKLYSQNGLQQEQNSDNA